MRRLSLLALTMACVGVALMAPLGMADEPPAPMREFRAAWIATVSNIDWPSRSGLPVRRQKRELTRLLDAAVEMKLNAVILQIRPCADALYASELEPWSEFLTGRMGQAPEPAYDPLEFAVEEAHRRGLQLHVWFNPYRVRSAGARSEASPDHASLADADIVREYGEYLWFDPGEPKAADRFIDVLVDVVTRYDVDGVHIDDYFYPYPVAEDGKPVPFPDDASYERAVAAGETLERDDWRRQNVDALIERMYFEVKRAKPWVLVGISPFGIWRPGHPEGIKGLDQYSALYADARKWLRQGWVDYFTPQLYWRIEGEQSYPKLLAWWKDENLHGRHLWPGNGAHNLRRDASVEPARNAWPAEELLGQIQLTRELLPGQGGNVFFSMKSLVSDRDGIRERLAKGAYAEGALVPESPWLGDETPATPEVMAAVEDGDVNVTMSLPGGEAPWLWVVRVRDADGWWMAMVPGGESEFQESLESGEAEEVAVSAVTRLGREGPVVRATLGEGQ